MQNSKSMENARMKESESYEFARISKCWQAAVLFYMAAIPQQCIVTEHNVTLLNGALLALLQYCILFCKYTNTHIYRSARLAHLLQWLAMGGLGNQGLIPTRGKDFSLCCHIKTTSWAHPESYLIGTR
jgi:hypothetical protein